MTKISFKEYKLSEEILKSVDILKFKSPTIVQQKVIPIALEERDIVVKSQTGSGKTAAFAIPICELVNWEENKPQALVLTPTRELAVQVREDFFNIGRFKRLKVAAVYGKAPFYNQERELKQKTHIVVGTPGRTIDHIKEGNFTTDNIKYLVLDEADEMLSMGFLGQVEEIISALPAKRVTMLFSATMPEDIEFLCSEYMKDPEYVEIQSESLTVDRIGQEGYMVDEDDKIDLLKDITIVENPDSCIIFCNTREKVDEVYAELNRANYTSDKIHGGMEQKDRMKVMDDFKHGYFRYLVATDVAARGIDVDNITHVINYDIPDDAESYIHRIGRTGRIGNLGMAVTIVTERDKDALALIERKIKMDFNPKKIERKKDKDDKVQEIRAKKDAIHKKYDKKNDDKKNRFKRGKNSGAKKYAPSKKTSRKKI